MGKATMTAKKISRKNRKGVTPRRMSPVGMLKIVFTANKSIPIGGVMSPICVFTENTTANQRGSNPRLTINGTKIGIVSSVMVSGSRIQPKKRRIIFIAIITSHGDTAVDSMIVSK